MLDKILFETIRPAARYLLDCSDDFLLMKNAVDELYQLFSRITGVKIENLSSDKDIMLPSGKAISSASAAHCLLEMKRTAVFLRGINKAILQQLSANNGKQIRILYAGTGPYGTLLVPLLVLYTSGQIKVDLLDINPASLEALRKLVETLGIRDFIGEMYCADATTFSLKYHYDIVISETMLACLKSEPQLAVMQNMIPQLSSDSIFIPENISIEAALTNSKMEQDRLSYYEGEQPPFQRIELGTLFRVNRHHLDAGQMHKTVEIPDAAVDFPILKLFTTVTVFADEMLSENDSSITLPVKYYDLRQQPVHRVEFWYVQGEKPHIESRIKQYTLLTETIEAEI